MATLSEMLEEIRERAVALWGEPLIVKPFAEAPGAMTLSVGLSGCPARVSAKGISLDDAAEKVLSDVQAAYKKWQQILPVVEARAVAAVEKAMQLFPEAEYTFRTVSPNGGSLFAAQIFKHGLLEYGALGESAFAAWSNIVVTPSPGSSNMSTAAPEAEDSTEVSDLPAEGWHGLPWTVLRRVAQAKAARGEGVVRDEKLFDAIMARLIAWRSGELIYGPSGQSNLEHALELLLRLEEQARG